MSLIALGTLLVRETVQTIYQAALDVAEELGLPVTSWHPGDPTRSLYWHLSETLSTLEGVVVGYIASGFLDYAAARAEEDGTESQAYQWLLLVADQVYGYEPDAATYAAGAITLTNGGGGYFPIEPGDVTVKSSITDKTYHNTSGGILASGPGTTLSLDFEADEPGSGSSAAATEIDTVVTGLPQVTCSNAAAFVGLDAESPSSIVAGCRAKLGALSPNGPADAFDYVACNASLTGTSNVTRSRTYDDSTTGDVVQYLAGPSGAVAAGDVSAVVAAIADLALPLCITYTGASATNKTAAVTYELWLYDSVGQTEAEVKAAVESALAAMFLVRPIGGDIKGAVGTGYLYHSLVEATIKAAFPGHVFDLQVTLPSGDTPLAANEVPVKGTITATAVHFEAAP